MSIQIKTNTTFQGNCSLEVTHYSNGTFAIEGFQKQKVHQLNKTELKVLLQLINEALEFDFKLSQEKQNKKENKENE